MNNNKLTGESIILFANSFPMPLEMMQGILELAIKHPNKFTVDDYNAIEECLNLIKTKTV